MWQTGNVSFILDNLMKSMFPYQICMEHRIVISIPPTWNPAVELIRRGIVEKYCLVRYYLLRKRKQTARAFFSLACRRQSLFSLIFSHDEYPFIIPSKPFTLEKAGEVPCGIF